MRSTAWTVKGRNVVAIPSQIIIAGNSGMGCASRRFGNVKELGETIWRSKRDAPPELRAQTFPLALAFTKEALGPACSCIALVIQS